MSHINELTFRYILSSRHIYDSYILIFDYPLQLIESFIASLQNITAQTLILSSHLTTIIRCSLIHSYFLLFSFFPLNYSFGDKCIFPNTCAVFTNTLIKVFTFFQFPSFPFHYFLPFPL